MRKNNNIILLAIAVVIMFVCFGGCSAYNGMVSNQEAATTALANVQATYQRRADLIPNLAKTVQAYAKHEKSTLEEVAKARAAASQIKLDAGSATPQQLQQFEKAQGDLTQALGKLMVVVERYPDLKASENFHSLQIQLEGTENRINEARQKYNETVQTYNMSIRRFPNVIFARLFGFDRMTKFEAAQGTEKAPQLNFDE